MADTPISTSEFHKKLTDLVAEVAANTIRGGNLEWEDAERFLMLTLSTMSINVYPSTVAAEAHPAGAADELYVSMSVVSGGGDEREDDEGFLRRREPLSAIIIAEATEWELPKSDIVEYRDALAASLAKLDNWLAA